MPTLTLPAANVGWWTPHTAAGTPGVGIPGGIHQYRIGGASARTNLRNMVTEFGADDAGIVDCYELFIDAIAACADGDVIYFPAGRFYMNGQVNFNKDNFTVRGAGRDTVLVCGSGHVWLFSGTGQPVDGAYQQAISGTRTKGTTSLTVADTTGYTVGRIFGISYLNEEDDARIEAGAAPTWGSGGGERHRLMRGVITAVPNGTTLEIDPPLVWDGTDFAPIIGTSSDPIRQERVGFEDFSVEFDIEDHPFVFLNTDQAVYCWMYNVHFLNYHRTASNGSCVLFDSTYRCEIRKCLFNALPDSDSDGLLQTGGMISCLIVDNIFTGGLLARALYDNGNSHNNVIAYNFSREQFSLVGFHNIHPSLNLIEGNIGVGIHFDSYHGSCSNNTIHRNWIDGAHGAPFGKAQSLSIDRFAYNTSIIGNVWGEDGVHGWSAGNTVWGDVSWPMRLGYPNIVSNGFTGTAQPTDGDFWLNWKMSGELVTRTSDLIGVFDMPGGILADGMTPIYCRWDNQTEYMGVGQAFGGTVTDVTGDLVTVEWPAGGLPLVGEICRFFRGPDGFQELNYDVRESSQILHNYESQEAGTGAVEDATTDDIPDSWAWSAEPDLWSETEGFDQPFPPVNPDAPVFDFGVIPAGYRYLLGNPPPEEETQSTAVSITCGTLVIGS